MAKLNREDVLKLAKLARLQLSEDEIVEFSEELSEILVYVEKLQQIELGELKPTNQVNGLTNVMRKDEVGNYGYEPHDMLENVPQTEDGQIKVKRMIG